MGKNFPVTHYVVKKWILCGLLKLPFGTNFNTLSEAEAFAIEQKVPCTIEDSNGRFIKAYQ